VNLQGQGAGEKVCESGWHGALARSIFAKLLYFQFVRQCQNGSHFFLDVIASEVRRIEFYSTWNVSLSFGPALTG